MMESTPILADQNKTNVTLCGVFCQRLLPNKKGKWLLFILLFILIIPYCFLIKYRSYLNKMSSQGSPMSHPNLLDGCRYVYIDMGTNIGVQIRKLYEPHLYPGAAVLPLFKQIFGNHSNEVCSVGFEANPVHNDYLKEFEHYCLRRNWRVKIFTSTAVSIIEGNLTFYTEPSNERNNYWGATLEGTNWKKKGNIIVPSIDIVSWFKTTVLNRKRSPEFALSKVMMKSDIEGHDSVVIANLIFGGVYCSIDLIYGEHLTKEFLNATSVLQRYSKACKTKLIYMDDESYYKARFPFNVHNLTNKTMLI